MTTPPPLVQAAAGAGGPAAHAAHAGAGGRILGLRRALPRAGELHRHQVVLTSAN